MEAKSKLYFSGIGALQRRLSKPDMAGAKYVILVDENTLQLCLPTVVGNVDQLQEADFIELPCGEEAKSLDVVAQVWQTLIEGEADRNTVIVNVGGGSVSDVGGFVAASYKRGVRYINVPTTLLSMVDAAIGGKTGIDYGGVKNSIGFFHQPVATIIEPVLLQTLDAQQLMAGKCEMIKTAAICDPDLYAQLLSTTDIAAADIAQVARIKQRVVNADFKDHGIRHILNFGHTVGHAVEVYSALPHGIAVGVGMLVAMYLSVHKLGFNASVYNTYLQWVTHNLPHLPTYTLKDTEALLAIMRHDKKCSADRMLWVLLKELGAAAIDVEVSDNEVRDAVLHCCRG